MKYQVLLLVIAVLLAGVIMYIYYATPVSFIGHTAAPPPSPKSADPLRPLPAQGTAKEGPSESAKQSPESKLGYIMSMHYTDQLTGSSANLLNLQCFAGHYLKNVKVIEPFLLSIGTILGTNLSPTYEQYKPEEANKVKLSDVFDIEAWDAYIKSRNYAPFVSWSDFLASHPKQLILAHHTWTTTDCDPEIMKNSTKEFVIDNKFKVVRRICLDFRKMGSITPQQFVKAIYGDYKPDSVVVVFNFWGGISPGVQNYRLAVKGTPCNRGSDIRLTHQSKLVSSDVEEYTTRYMHKAKSYIAVMFRFEYYGISHNLNAQSAESQRKRLMECYKSVSSKVESLRREKNIKDTLLTMDFSRHGSCAFWRKKNPFISITVLNETVPKFFEMLFGDSLNQDLWEQSFESVAHFKVPGYIAVMQKTLAANSACLVLVGGGSFQGSAKTLHNELHPGCVMGNILTLKERKALKPHLQGIEPASLAAIIWDSINYVGVDDDTEKLGIHFMNGTEFEDRGQARVIFWDDNNGATDLPRKVFLEILLMMGEQIVNEYESNYDLETATDLGIAVKKLQLALVTLHETIDGLSGEEGAKTYRERIDSGASLPEDSISENLIEEIRIRRGSYMWTNGEQGSKTMNVNRRQSKGIEGVIDRLPELRRRYDKTVCGSSKLDRVRKKIQILTMFRKGNIAPTAILEEEDECLSYSASPSANSLDRKSIQDNNMPTSSPMMYHSISRSSSACSYESASSTKQLLRTDSPRNGTTHKVPLPNFQIMRHSQNQDSSATLV